MTDSTLSSMACTAAVQTSSREAATPVTMAVPGIDGENVCSLSAAEKSISVTVVQSVEATRASQQSAIDKAQDSTIASALDTADATISQSVSPASTTLLSYDTNVNAESPHLVESTSTAATEYPAFRIRDFAYPSDDPRHHGDFSRPSTQLDGSNATGGDLSGSACQSPPTRVSLIDLFQQCVVDGSGGFGDYSNDNVQFFSMPSNNGYSDFHTAAQGPSQADDSSENATSTLQLNSSRQDEYTGPAKAIRDFCTENPVQLQFKEGEEFWIRYQMEPGVLLAHKDGQDCHVREADVDFTNHS